MVEMDAPICAEALVPMSDAMSGHDLGLRGRVDAALRLAATTHAGHVIVNAGFLSGLAMDLLEATPEALAALREDPDILALVAAEVVDDARVARTEESE